MFGQLAGTFLWAISTPSEVLTVLPSPAQFQAPCRNVDLFIWMVLTDCSWSEAEEQWECGPAAAGKRY